MSFMANVNMVKVNWAPVNASKNRQEGELKGIRNLRDPLRSLPLYRVYQERYGEAQNHCPQDDV